MNKTAMILAAGLGTRLGPMTHDKPKALVEIKGKTLLQRNIENLVHQGFNTIIINIHHFGEQVIRFVETHSFDTDIYLSDERGCLMDTGGGIVQALPFFHDTQAVLIHNVDILSDVPLSELYDRFTTSSDDAWLFTQDRETTRKLLFDEHDLLLGWRNKTDGQFKWTKGEKEHFKELAFSGMHIFKPELFASFGYQRYSIIDLYLQQARTHRIRSVEIHPTYWFDIGKINDFPQIENALTRLTSHPQPLFPGRGGTYRD